MKKLEIKKMELVNGEVPTVKVIITENEEPLRVGYLAPFRNKCFQVSSDQFGNGDLGGSAEIDMLELVKSSLSDRVVREVLSGQAMIALSNFGKDAFIPNPYMFGDISENFREFVTASMEYLRSR